MAKIKSILSSNTFSLAVVTTASLLLYLLYSSVSEFATFYYDDTGSYFLAADEFMQGNIDSLRTPVYPLLCRFAVWLSAPYALRIISIVQEICFLLSITALYLAIRAFKANKAVSIIATSAYALCPILFSYSNLIFTESLSITSTIFLIYSLSKTVYGKRIHTYGIISIVLLFFMIMLRPFFICFIPGTAIVILYALYKCHNTRKNFILLCTSAVIAVSALTTYCYWYYSAYGKFAFSNVYELNRDMAMYNWGMTSYPNGLNYYIYHSPTDINGDSLTIYEAWKWQPSEEYRTMCDSTYEKHKVRYIKNKIIEFHESLYLSYSNSPKRIAPLYYITRLFYISLSQIYLFVILFAIIELYAFFRGKKNIVISIALVSFVTASVFTSIWGADGQYTRLMIPMAPCLFAMLAIFASHFTHSSIKPDATQ